MGYAKIIWIYEDGIRHPSENLSKLVVDAVLDVCLNGAKSFPVRNHSNCVNFCDEVHSIDAQVYLWVGNCLRPIYKLDEDRLDLAAQLISDLRQQRKGNITQR